MNGILSKGVAYTLWEVVYDSIYDGEHDRDNYLFQNQEDAEAFCRQLMETESVGDSWLHDALATPDRDKYYDVWREELALYVSDKFDSGYSAEIYITERNVY